MILSEFLVVLGQVKQKVFVKESNYKNISIANLQKFVEYKFKKDIDRVMSNGDVAEVLYVGARQQNNFVENKYLTFIV